MNVALDMAALNGTVVTEAHAKVCRERGHATHKVDGIEQIHCPRCGEARTEEITVTGETIKIGDEISLFGDYSGRIVVTSLNETHIFTSSVITFARTPEPFTVRRKVA